MGEDAAVVWSTQSNTTTDTASLMSPTSPAADCVTTSDAASPHVDQGDKPKRKGRRKRRKADAAAPVAAEPRSRARLDAPDPRGSRVRAAPQSAPPPTTTSRALVHSDEQAASRALRIQATWRAYAARRQLVGEQPEAETVMNRWIERRKLDTSAVIRSRVLGRGASGTVWLGVHATTGEQLAVKDIHVDASVAGGGVGPVQREFELLCRLAHPNIVQIRGFMLTETVASIFLEYVPGGSLHQLLYQSDRGLHEELIRTYSRQAVEGLRYLHNRSVLHRDVKPHNLLVDCDGTLKLADFGACKSLRDSGTATNHLVGTPAYMAPDAIAGVASRGGDVWALGCSIVELASRRMPWHHVAQKCQVALIFQIGIGAGRDGHHPLIPEHLSEHCHNFLTQSFRADPGKRPSCNDLLRHPWIESDDPVPGVEDVGTYRSRTDREAAEAAEGSARTSLSSGSRDGSGFWRDLRAAAAGKRSWDADGTDETSAPHSPL